MWPLRGFPGPPRSPQGGGATVRSFQGPLCPWLGGSDPTQGLALREMCLLHLLVGGWQPGAGSFLPLRRG